MDAANWGSEKIHFVRNHLGTIKSEVRKHAPQLEKVSAKEEEKPDLRIKECICPFNKYSPCASHASGSV